MKPKLIIWGGTGNFKVLHNILSEKYNIIGFFDKNKNLKTYYDIPHLGDFADFKKWILNKTEPIYYIISIGPGLGKQRMELHYQLKSYGCLPIIAVHNSSIVLTDVEIGEGSMLFSGSILGVGVKIHNGCIINTAASVDHECELKEGVTVGPGARLAGLVHVDKYADIYTGAIIIPGITVGKGAVVGAGAVVIDDVKPYHIVVGNPAKTIKIMQINEK